MATSSVTPPTTERRHLLRHLFNRAENAFSPAHDRQEPLPQRLAIRRADFYMKQTAHLMEGAKCDQKGRVIGLTVVILTSVVGTSIIVSLGHNSQWWAKAIVGVLSVSAAIAAAWKENAQYGNRTRAHEMAASDYENLRYGVEELQDKYAVGLMTCQRVEAELEKLENKAEKLSVKDPPIPNSAIPKAVQFIKDLERQRQDLVNASF